MKRALPFFLLLVILLFLRAKLGIVRYFDVDEFAHLHWGYSLLIGEKPYRDFFYLFPPFFLFPIAFIFNLFGRNIVSILAARIFIFIVFLLLNISMMVIFSKMRGILTAIFALIVFSFLPIPYDKMLEVRPDLLATLLAICGIYLFTNGFEAKKPFMRLFLSGLAYSTSIFIVPKTLFFILPPISVLGYIFAVYLKKRQAKQFWIHYRSFFLGLAMPVTIAVIYLLTTGNFQFALYSITRMSSGVTAVLGKKFYMRPDIFFYPNDTFYAFGGYNIPLYVNLVIYIIGSLWAIWAFLSSLSSSDANKNIREFIISASFIVNLYAFVRIYPLKHSQYLIMVAPFIAFYFSDLWLTVTFKIGSFFEKSLRIKKALKLGYVLTLMGAVFLTWWNFRMFRVKESWSNKQTLDKISQILTDVPAGEPIFDLVGMTIFYPNGYYFCCLPYGQYEEALEFPTPNIEKVMNERKTKYVYIDNKDRLNVIPPIAARYIVDNFETVNSEGSLMIRKRRENVVK